MTGASKRRKLSGEFALIERYFAPLAKDAKGAVGLKDDAATLSIPKGQELVVTADTLIEGVHFFKSDSADLVARKALRVNLSDLAAKGARPAGYLLAISLSPWVDEKWVARFAKGLAADQRIFAIPLLGGDTTAAPDRLSLTITALGYVPSGKILRRGSARIGDDVFVTGTIGDGGAGLAALKGGSKNLPEKAKAYLISRYRLPEPRLFFGQKLIGIAHASLDISDGLIADLGHIADASAVRISIDAGKIPLSAGLREIWGGSTKAILRAASSGDDYEIAFTAPASARAKIRALAKSSGLKATPIGRVERGQGVVVHDANGRILPFSSGGYRHF